MRYLGAFRGAGTLSCGAEKFGRADYDFEGFLVKPGEVSASGEIRLEPDLLKLVFGRKGLQLLTDDGRVLSLRFSQRQLDSNSDVAHVEVGGDLPSAKHWRH